MSNIRNFVIIAHIDAGKSTLADRFLEITGTVRPEKMRPQYLDRLDLERERGITIKMAPVRMMYHANRGITLTDTRNNAEGDLLYKDLSYNIRGAVFEVRKRLGLGHKESIYHNSLAEEFKKRDLHFESEKKIDIFYDGRKVGSYQPDFVVEDKIVIELKALPELGRPQTEQVWSYLKGCEYKLALLINFGSTDVEIKRVVYDTARFPRASALSQRMSAQIEDYILNLIDTPGHSDFSYEVSRALHAVEGAVLLVDGTKGIQAQTLANFRSARAAGLTIVGAVNKVDLHPTHFEQSVRELAELLDTAPEDILRISAKTGEGAKELLDKIIASVPPPKMRNGQRDMENGKTNSLPHSPLSRALIFDSLYDDHKGILAFVRVMDGVIRTGDAVTLLGTKSSLKIKEVGYFSPDFVATSELREGEVGYIATGIKVPAMVAIGDTVIARTAVDFTRNNAGQNQDQHMSASSQRQSANLALPGYKEPKPVVYVSFYPDGDTEFHNLKTALERLRLTDAALTLTPDANDALGRGMKVGFLGQLHFEITASRLESEFKLSFITSFPSIAYRVLCNTADQSADERRQHAELRGNNLPGQRSSMSSPRESASSQRKSAMLITTPQDFPDKPDRVWQPMITIEIVTTPEYLSAILGMRTRYELEITNTKSWGEHLILSGTMPLAELIRDFDDTLKSVSQGYASWSYELSDEKIADVRKLEILVADEVVPALTRIVSKKDIEREGRQMAERLKEMLPKQQFAQAIQAKSEGRIIARETIPAMKKLLGNFGKTGGDRTRKMKLWKKQQRGKERLKERGTGRVRVPPSLFKELLKK